MEYQTPPSPLPGSLEAPYCAHRSESDRIESKFDFKWLVGMWFYARGDRSYTNMGPPPATTNPATPPTTASPGTVRDGSYTNPACVESWRVNCTMPSVRALAPMKHQGSTRHLE